MARAKEGDTPFKKKIYSFIDYLVNEKGIAYASIARAINAHGHTHRIKHRTIGSKMCNNVMKAYSNNYINWCNKNNYEVDSELTEYLEKLYGG